MGTVRAGASTAFGRGRRALTLVFVAASLLSCASASAGERGVIVRESGRRTLVVRGGEAREGIHLPDTLVVAGTDSVWVDAAPLVRGVDYDIDYARGRLTLVEAPPDSASVVVSYLYLPLGLAPVYRCAEIESMAVLPEGFAREARLVEAYAASAPRPSPPGLRVGGSKTFGITMGSDRDPTLEQSLRMSISGRITRDVTVNAYLSDQNTPLVPEGDTEELRALDRVLIEIEGEGVAATMGDYELAIEGGSLGRLRRELSGAMVTADLRSVNVLAAGARLAGQFASLTFRGVNGKQGPYLLTDASGSTGIAVVAGSERVWLDGERLRRGRDNDYVIDYGTGEIEFTERRPITSDNEITVDYEYALSDYERDIYAGRAALEVGGERVGLGVSFFREADDRNASASVTLTDEMIAVLEAAGDDAELAHDDGVDSVGMGYGDYVMIEEGVFEYAGADSGDYDLTFERCEGGEYEYDYTDGRYVYVGPGQGDYRLGRSLPLPTEHDLVTVDGHLELPGGGHVTAEAALSSFDANTFSDIDDHDNLGNAALLAGRLPNFTFDAVGGGTVELSVSARRVAGNFRGMGRFRDVRYAEKWELEDLELPAGELLLEGRTTVSLHGGGRLSASWGRLARGDALESKKAEFSGSVRPTRRSRVWFDGRVVQVRCDTDTSSAARDRRIFSGGVEQEVGALRPGLSYRHDSRVGVEADGERFDEYSVFVETARSGDLEFRARCAYRLTDALGAAGWEMESTTVTQEYRVTSRGSEKLSIEAAATRRWTRYAEGVDADDAKHDLASLRVSHRSFGGALKGEFRYSVTSTEVEERERYVSEDDGVEVVHVVSTGRFRPVTDLSVSTRWAIKPGPRSGGRRGLPEPSAFQRFLSSFSLETDVKLREMTTTRDRWKLYTLDPSVIQGEDTVRGEVSGHHVARYVSPDGSRSARLTFRTRDVLDRIYSNASERRKERALTLDLKLAVPGGTTYRLEGDLDRRERRSDGEFDEYDIAGRNLFLEATARRFGDLEARVRVSASREDEAIDGISAVELAVTPSLTYRFAGRGAATASLTRTDVDASAETLPTYLAGGRRPGVTTEWRLSGDYRFNRYLTGTVSYTGESRPGSDARHTVDVRVNAFF